MNEYIEVLKKYAVFEGRARRREYWMFVLVNFIVYMVIGFVAGFMGGMMEKTIPFLYMLAVLIPGIAVTIRRLHDTNRSGFWILIGLVPIIGLIITIIFTAQDSKPGDNQYGPNPKGIQAPVATASPSQEQHSEQQPPIQQ